LRIWPASRQAGDETSGLAAQTGLVIDMDSMVWSAPPILGLLWCAIVSMIAVAASAIATRIGEALAAEVGLPDGEDPVAAQFR
jgi:hypothetical protein